MNISIAHTYHIDKKHIAIKPSFNYGLANKFFNKFQGQFDDRHNYEAYKSIEGALINRPGYSEYLKEKSFLLQRLGYNDDAFKLYRIAMDNNKSNSVVQFTSSYIANQHKLGYFTNEPANTHPTISNHHQKSIGTTVRRIKAGKPHRIKRVMVIASLIIAFALTSNNATAQQVQGYVTDKLTKEAIENITVEAISQNDTTKRKSTLTDATGFYELKNIITAIGDEQAFYGDRMTITYRGNKMRIEITSRQSILKGKLYDVSGREVAEVNFKQTGEKRFQATVDIPATAGQVLIFHDGVHRGKKLIPGTLPNYGTETVNLTKLSRSNRLKNAQAENDENFENFIFRIDDNPDTDKYQPLEVVKSVDMENISNADFELISQDNYTLIINSKDENGKNLENVNWQVLSTDSVLIGQGNTGTNSLDTIKFTKPTNTLDIILKSNKEEHTDYRTETNLEAEQEELRITNNTLIQYLYQLGIIAKDSETGTPLDSVEVEAYQNGELLANNNSLENTVTAIEFTKPNHTQEIGFVMKRNGYENSDTIKVTVNEGEENNFTEEMTKETQEQTVAYFWRAFVPELDQLGTTADIVITNTQFNYNDTIFAVGSNSWWKDTVQVNPTGTTEYEVKYLVHVQEGSIPYYPLIKKIDMNTNKLSYGRDTTKILEQQQKIKGRVMILKNNERVNMTGGVDIIVWNEDRTVKLDSIRSTDGYYETGPYQTGFHGEMDIHIPNDHPTRMDTLYLGHKGILITPKSENGERSVGGPVIMEDEVINFEDSIKTYNALLFPEYRIDAETGMLAKVNPAQVWGLDGNSSYDLPTMKWPEGINVYFGTTSENNPWIYEMANRIEKNFGIPFKINKTETPRSHIAINITSLDDSYLNSIKEQTGMNITVTTGPGVTYMIGGSDLEEIGVHTVDEVRIRGPTEGQQGSATEITDSERELIHRINDTSDTSEDLYKSISNGALANDMDTTKMVYDHINFNIIYYYRQGRIQSDPKERINSGSYTMRPNNNTDFYSNTSQPDFYYGDIDRWFHWDTTNIPEWNKKFFEEN